MPCPTVTLTLNPAIDVSSDAEEVRPTQKTRTFGQQIEAGGGGINVAKMLAELGVPVRATYLAGGPTGGALTNILSRLPIERDCIAIEGATRLGLAVYERSTGIEYRFVPEGPEVSEREWQQAIDRSVAADCRYFVASGSLPPGVPDDFYARLARALRPGGARFILDTSGAELKAAVEQGGIFLLKPSDRELREFAGEELDDDGLAAVALEIVRSGKAEHVAVTLGRKGAILALADGAWQLPALQVETVSALGAGDSFVGAMTYAFCTGEDALQAFRLGVAAGAAAASSRGAKLCSAAEVRRLLQQVPEPRRIAG